MKKYIVLTLAVVLVMSVALTGCAPQKTNLILATGGTSGTYYPFGGSMAQIFIISLLPRSPNMPRSAII